MKTNRTIELHIPETLLFTKLSEFAKNNELKLKHFKKGFLLEEETKNEK